MKLPRFSIAGLMALVFVVAYSIAATKELIDLPRNTAVESGLILFGVLPTATILLMGFVFLIAYRRESAGRNWATLLGFEIGGALACLAFFIVALAAKDWVLHSVEDSLEWLGLKPFGLISGLVSLSLILLPQIAAGVLGGWLARVYQMHENRASQSLRPPRIGSSESFRSLLLESARADIRTGNDPRSA